MARAPKKNTTEKPAEKKAAPKPDESPAKPAAPAPAAAPRSNAPSVTAAAKVLGVYESDVVSVERSDDGHVAVTKDGQRYLLTGHANGDFTWLRAGAVVEVATDGEGK